MKQLSTLTRYLLIAFTAFVVTACSKDNTPAPEPADPKLLSFGFYAEDNEDNLFRDYVVENVTGNTIQIDLPREADRTKLVARFTTTENGMVTVNGVPQQSGITQTNFSTPADYIVTEGGVNARYTVTIANAADYVWTKVGSYTDEQVSEFDMKLNPVTGAPYFFYMLSNDDAEERKGFAIKYEDNSWSTLGNKVSAGRVGNRLSMVMDKEGTPFVAYQDYTAEDSQAPTIQKYNGTSWSTVGQEGIYKSSLSYLSLGINPTNDQPIFFSSLNAIRDGGLVRRALSVSLFNGSTWSIHNEVTGRPTAQAVGTTSSKTVGETLYLLALNSTGTQTYSVYTYKQGQWTTIIDKALDPAANNTLLSQVGIDVDQEGNIYIIIADDPLTHGTYNLHVRKYSPLTETWSRVGNIINVKASSYSLAVSPGGTPHVLYRNDNGLPTVTAFDSEAQDWGTPRVLDTEAAKNTSVFIEFTADGTGYASYIKDLKDNNYIVLHKFDSAN